jgi:hypothetical protein
MKWLEQEESTRKRSNKQEKKIAKKIGGSLFCNSGAKFGENDLYNEFIEVEAKTTKNKQYTLKVEELLKMQSKCRADRIAIEVIEFGNGEEYAIISFSSLIEIINKLKNDEE